MQAGTIVLGDVKNIADKTKKAHRLNQENRQKIANWPHGQLAQYITYKAAEKGISVEHINEAYTSKTCPQCGHLNKPKGRNYSCSACGFVGHRDAVGASNILSKRLYGKLAQIIPCAEIKYRHPFAGKRRPPDTRQVASAS